MSPCFECGEYECDIDCEFSHKCECCEETFLTQYYYSNSQGFGIPGGHLTKIEEEDFDEELDKHDFCDVRKCCGTKYKHRSWCVYDENFKKERVHKFEQTSFDEKVCLLCNEKIIGNFSNQTNDLGDYLKYCKNLNYINKKIEFLQKKNKNLQNEMNENNKLIEELIDLII